MSMTAITPIASSSTPSAQSSTAINSATAAAPASTSAGTLMLCKVCNGNITPLQKRVDLLFCCQERVHLNCFGTAPCPLTCAKSKERESDKQRASQLTAKEREEQYQKNLNTLKLSLHARLGRLPSHLLNVINSDNLHPLLSSKFEEVEVTPLYDLLIREELDTTEKARLLKLFHQTINFSPSEVSNLRQLERYLFLPPGSTPASREPVLKLDNENIKQFNEAHEKLKKHLKAEMEKCFEPITLIHLEKSFPAFISDCIDRQGLDSRPFGIALAEAFTSLNLPIRKIARLMTIDWCNVMNTKGRISKAYKEFEAALYQEAEKLNKDMPIQFDLLKADKINFSSFFLVAWAFHKKNPVNLKNFLATQNLTSAELESLRKKFAEFTKDKTAAIANKQDPAWEVYQIIEAFLKAGTALPPTAAAIAIASSSAAAAAPSAKDMTAESLKLSPATINSMFDSVVKGTFPLDSFLNLITSDALTKLLAGRTLSAEETKKLQSELDKIQDKSESYTAMQTFLAEQARRHQPALQYA